MTPERRAIADENAALLTERQQLEKTKFLLGQLEEEARSHHKEIFSTPFYAIGKGEQMKLYTRSDIELIGGDESKIYGQDWHIRSYRNDVVEIQAGGKVIGKDSRRFAWFSQACF